MAEGSVLRDRGTLSGAFADLDRFADTRVDFKEQKLSIHVLMESGRDRVMEYRAEDFGVDTMDALYHEVIDFIADCSNIHALVKQNDDGITYHRFDRGTDTFIEIPSPVRRLKREASRSTPR